MKEFQWGLRVFYKKHEFFWNFEGVLQIIPRNSNGVGQKCYWNSEGVPQKGYLVT